MQDLVFGLQFQPDVVSRMTVAELHWWHKQAVAFQKRMKK